MKFYSVVRAAIEVKFEILGHFLYQRAALVALFLLPVIGYLASQIFLLKIDSSIESYLPENDPALSAYTDFQDQFGSDDRVIVGIKAQDIFDPATLQNLQKFQQEIESRVPHIAQVKSLTNALYIKNQGDGLVFGVLSDLLQHGGDESLGFKEFVTSSPFYKNQYFSPDEQLALVSLTLSCPSIQADSLDVLAGFAHADMREQPDSAPLVCSLNNSENGEMIGVLEEIKQKYQGDDFQIFITGMPILRQFLRTTMKEDTKNFLLLSILVIIILLYILFGRISGVVFPLVVVACSVSSTIGLMALMGEPFQSPTRILPSFLIAVGIGASVHIMFIFYQLFSEGLTKREAIARALGHSGLPVLLTCLTTAAGLASFSAAKVTPVADIGFFAALGVFISLFYTILLLPVLLALFPLKGSRAPLFIRFSGPINKTIDRLVTVSIKYARGIVIFCVGLCIFSWIGISQLKLVHDPLLRLPESSALRQATEKISHHFPGIATVEVLVETNGENGLASPEIALKFEKFAEQVRDYSEGKISVFNVSSIYDSVEEIHKNLAGDGQGKTFPQDDSRLIAQELLLLESGFPQAVRQFTDASFQLGRVTVQVPWVDAMAYDPFLDYIDNLSQEIFKESGSAKITGIVPLLARTIRAAIESMVTSYFLAIMMISAAMIMLIGHFKLGLISMFPNLLPIFLTLGFMGWTGIPLDMYTLLIGSIALGLVVDDTIHFMYNFRRYFQQTNDVSSAVKKTLQTSGMAMLITTIVLSCGAFIFMISEMRSLYYFGMLTGMTIIMALLADLFLSPALMAMYYKSKVKNFEKDKS